MRITKALISINLQIKFWKFLFDLILHVPQGSKIALVCSYLRVPQAAGQVKILIFLVKINLFPMYTNIFVMQGKCLF